MPHVHWLSRRLEPDTKNVSMISQHMYATICLTWCHAPYILLLTLHMQVQLEYHMKLLLASLTHVWSTAAVTACTDTYAGAWGCFKWVQGGHARMIPPMCVASMSSMQGSQEKSVPKAVALHAACAKRHAREESKGLTCAPSKRVPGTLNRAALATRLPLLSILYVDRRLTPASAASRRACLDSLQQKARALHVALRSTTHIS